MLSPRHCEHTSEQSGDLPSWSPADELVNSLTSHAAPRLGIPAPTLAPPSASLAFLLTFILLLTVIQFLHLNLPLPHPLVCCKAGGQQLSTLTTPKAPGATRQRKYHPNALSLKILIPVSQGWNLRHLCFKISPGDSNLQSGLRTCVRGFPAFTCKLRSPTAFITSPFSPAERIQCT